VVCVPPAQHRAAGSQDCKAPIRGVQRYSRLIAKQFLDSVLKKSVNSLPLVVFGCGSC
jgi:hypothetical protein